MMNKTGEREIGTGASCFLIKDESIKGNWSKTPIHKFLEDEGFVCWGKAKSHEEIDWLYINIYSKVYSKGMYGVGLTKVVCDHAITWGEFLTIYNIYKKYEGLSVLKMTEQKQTETEMQTYKKISDVIKDIDHNSKEIQLSLGVVDYDAPHLLHYDINLHLPPYCDAKNKVFDFLNRIDMLETITIKEQKK